VQQHVQQPERLPPSRNAEFRPLTSGNDAYRPVRLEFASRGSGVQIPSAPQVPAGQSPAWLSGLVSPDNHGEPIVDLSAAADRLTSPHGRDNRAHRTPVPASLQPGILWAGRRRHRLGRLCRLGRPSRQDVSMATNRSRPDSNHAESLRGLKNARRSAAMGGWWSLVILSRSAQMVICVESV